MNLNELVSEYYNEGVTGAITFKSPFYKLLCKELGIKYKDLTRVGKALLKADAIDTLEMKGDYNAFKEGKYYLSK